MDYQVPQFIEVEDKIFGPLTLKQFIYIAGGAGLCAIILLSLPFIFGLILALPIAGFAGALAFYRVNGKPFIDVVEAGVGYFLSHRLYLWRKEKEEVPTTPVVTEAVVAPKEGMSRRKLEDLAWALDVKDTGKSETL